eukprot:1962807-Pyramimonas_sp.AAC.1
MNLKITLHSTASVSNTTPSAQRPPSPTQRPMLDGPSPKDELANNLLLDSLRLQRSTWYSTASFSNATPDARQPPPGIRLNMTFCSTPSVSNAAPSTQRPPSPTQRP